ncbi:hypothetical protein SH661x_002824 [Planctomicrobium sp. SH661]|uniref:hypothetical protein n=1 Tax=Planctomicrobium sp. SH661 TaxID=3448124 RepID=UPI003F5BB18D
MTAFASSNGESFQISNCSGSSRFPGASRSLAFSKSQPPAIDTTCQLERRFQLAVGCVMALSASEIGPECLPYISGTLC